MTLFDGQPVVTSPPSSMSGSGTSAPNADGLHPPNFLDMAPENRADAAAVIKCGERWAAGCQEIGQLLEQSAKTHAELTDWTWVAMAGARSLREALAIQADFARLSMEGTLNGTSKIVDATRKLAAEAMAPIASRINVSLLKETPQSRQ